MPVHLDPQKLQALFFQFPLAKGSYGFCNHHGVSIVPQTIVFGMPDDQVRIQKPVPSQLHTERMTSIVEKINELAESAGIAVDRMETLDHGKKGVAYSISDTHIARIQLGKLAERPPLPWIHQADAYSYDRGLDVTFEIMEVLPEEAESEQRQLLIAQAREEGWVIWDAAPQNFRKTPDGGARLIDPDAFCPKPK
jgi:hypothetical protein